MNEPQKVSPEFIELGRQLLTRIDGQTQEMSALIIGGSIELTIAARMDVLRQCEAALRDAETSLPMWEVLADPMKQHCLNSVRNAAQAAKQAIKTP